MNRTNEIILFLLSSAVIIPIIRSSVKTMLKTNIGKRNEKKIKRKPTIVDRVFLTYTIGYTKKYSKLCKVMVVVNCIYIFVVTLFLALILLSKIMDSLWQIVTLSLEFKWFVLDIPILIFFFFGTRYSRHGGVEWRLKK